MNDEQEHLPPGLAVTRRSDEQPIEKQNKWGMRVSIALLVVSFAMVILWALAVTWPYDKFSYGEVGQVKTEEFTSEGIPVIRAGEPVTWDQDYCNFEANPTTSIRWADIYGDATASGFVDLEGEVSIEDRVASFEVPAIEFYGYQNGCETTEVFAILPDYVTPGSYYKLRIETSYSANPIRRPVSEASTHLFLYIDKDAPVP